MPQFKLLDARYQLEDAVGFIPDFLSESDPRGACDQFEANYCGGWHDMTVGKGGFTAFDDFRKLHYPGDPPLHALAEATLHGGVWADKDRRPERIIVYESAFVAVVAEDGSFRVSRLD